MNRRMISMASVSILAITAVAGTAIAQYSNQPPRNSVRLAERSAQMKTTLAEAISAAERHTSGVVIGIRLSMSKEAFQNEANGMRGFGREYDRESGWNRTGERSPTQMRDADGTATERRLNMPTTQNPTQDNSLDRTQDATRDRTQDAQRDAARDRTQDAQRDAARDRTQDAQRDAARDRTQDAQRDAARDRTQDAQRDATRDRTRDAQQDNWFDDMPGGIDDPSRDSAQGVNQNAQRTADSYADSSRPMYAIVTCVIDRARVRDVVIDMADGSVVGMQSVNAYERGMQDEYSQGMHSDSSQFAMVRATELMNATVRNAEGKRVGDIDELVLDPDSNRVLYGVLRRGGFLGLNESRFAVPARELSAPQDGRIRLNLNNSDFDGHSGFDNDNWPKQADAEWSTGWSSNDQRAPSATRIVKATDLIGTEVKCSEGQKVGEITDLIVEPRSGRVVYAIVTSDRGELVVPMSVVRAEGDARVMKMNHAEVMALPTIGDRDPDWSDARWNRRNHDSYNAPMDLTSVTTDADRR